MEHLRQRVARSSLQQYRRLTPRPQCRYAGDQGHAGSAKTAPVDEPLGAAFWTVVALIPGLYLTYTLSRPHEDGTPNAVARFANKYTDWRDSWSERNSRHTQIVEQAGHDRDLLWNTNPGNRRLRLRFPEVFNSCAAVNVPAGGGSINLEKVIAHYRDEQVAEEEAKMERLRKGEIPGQQTYTEIPPGKK